MVTQGIVDAIAQHRPDQEKLLKKVAGTQVPPFASISGSVPGLLTLPRKTLSLPSSSERNWSAPTQGQR